MNPLGYIPRQHGDRLFIAALVSGLCFALSLIFIDPLLLLLEYPIPRAYADLTFLSPNEPAWVAVKVAVMATLFLSMPTILYALWGHLPRNSAVQKKHAAGWFVGLGTLFFVLGGVFCYFLVLPLGLKFLLNWGVQWWKIQVTMELYYTFVTNLMTVFAFAFLTPLIMVMLVQNGYVKTVQLRKARPWFYCASFVIAAVLTPSDIITQVLLAVPLYCLYEFGVVVSIFFENSRNGNPGIP